jgi:hypothetical protein
MMMMMMMMMIMMSYNKQGMRVFSGLNWLSDSYLCANLLM